MPGRRERMAGQAGGAGAVRARGASALGGSRRDKVVEEAKVVEGAKVVKGMEGAKGVEGTEEAEEVGGLEDLMG